MGCLQSTEPQPERAATHEPYDDEEKEAKPTRDTKKDFEIPEMQSNTFAPYGGPNQPLKGIQVTNPTDDPIDPHNQQNRRGLAQHPSVLSNFENTENRGYDANQYNNLSPQSGFSANSNITNNTSSSEQNMNAIPEHRMMDSQGNVHVNKYYNVTRNHNLSNASKMTDMSEMPSPVTSDHSSTKEHPANKGLTPAQFAGHKMSVDSVATNSKPLWDDFSERGSVMTAATETV